MYSVLRRKLPPHQIPIANGQNGVVGKPVVLANRRDSENVNHRQVIQNVLMLNVVETTRRKMKSLVIITMIMVRLFVKVDGPHGTTGANVILLTRKEKGLARGYLTFQYATAQVHQKRNAHVTQTARKTMDSGRLGEPACQTVFNIGRDHAIPHHG